jgi:hypothetical protein
MNKGPWGGRGAEFWKSGGVVGWNVVFLLLAVWPGSRWVCSLKERVCSANHMEHINSGLLCVGTGSGVRWVRDSFVLTCVRWCLVHRYIISDYPICIYILLRCSRSWHHRCLFCCCILYSTTLKLCTTWWWPPLWLKHVVASYLHHIAT